MKGVRDGRGVGGQGQKGEGIKKHKLSQKCKVKHREYNQ